MGTEGGWGWGRVAPSQRGGFWGDSVVYHPLRLRGGMGRGGGESGLHQKHMHMTPSPTLTSLHFQTPTSGDTHSHPCIHFLVILGKKMDQRDFFFFTSWLSFCLNKLAPPLCRLCWRLYSMNEGESENRGGWACAIASVCIIHSRDGGWQEKTDEIIFNMLISELPGIRAAITHT